MTDQTLTERAPERAPEGARSGGGGVLAPHAGGGLLGRPAAFLVTAAVLVALFSWTFVVNTDRAAPTRDPAFYTWRTELLISDQPVRLLELEGAFDMFAAGYRLSAPIIGAFLRQIPGISPINTTVFLMAAFPILIALLLAGFAYRQRPDPLVFHGVALVSASLFLTPPFVGYIDNVMTLFFLAAAIWFVGPSRHSWAARTALFLLVLISGLTHPTTALIFVMTLGVLSSVRLLLRRFDLRSVLRDDGPMLATGFAAIVTTLAIWMVGIWGKASSLGESALPPPYDSDFFFNRMVQWIDTMNPWLNAPLFLLGAAGLLVATRRAWIEDELTSISFVWLAPLVGSFGFVAGWAYPYYRFFNTTLAWILLVGFGAYLAARFFIVKVSEGGIYRFAILGLVALVAIVVANFNRGYEVSGWNDPDRGWISDQARFDLTVLRDDPRIAAAEGPIVFVMDDEPPRPFQIWAFTKLSGNTSRFGLPHGRIDQAQIYLGSLDNFLAGEPTLREQDTYDMLSPALLDEIRSAERDTGAEPLVVVASIFNPAGANVGYASGEEPFPAADVEVIGLAGGQVFGPEGPVAGAEATAVEPAGNPLHLVRVVFGLFVLLVPGLLALRWFVPGARLPEALGMVPALSLTITPLVALVVLAIARSPFSVGLASLSLLVAIAIGAVLAQRARAAAPATSPP